MSDQDVRELVARVGKLELKLERDNRRLKLAGAAVVAVLLAVALVGAVMPQEIPEIIEARGFHVTGENGELRAAMDGYGIFYIDENGQERVWVANGISYWDENGNTRAMLGRVELTTPATSATATNITSWRWLPGIHP